MATIKTGPTISKVAGRIGEHVYSSWRGQGYIRSKSPNRANPRSPRQALARAGIAALAKAWHNVLNAQQRALWGVLANRGGPPLDPASAREPGSREVIPQPRPVLSGYDAFIRANQLRIGTGIAPIGSPVLTPGPTYPSPPTELIRDEAPPIPINFALDFDGANEYINLGNVLSYNYNQPFAWEFWLNSDTTAPSQGLVSKYVPTIGLQRGYQLRLDSDFLWWGLENEPLLELIMVKRAFSTIETWKHIVVTYDGTNAWTGLKIYVDAVVGQALVVHQPLSQSIISTNPLYFARHLVVGANNLNGQLDCTRNFNRNLIQADVNILFNAGVGLYGGNPLGDGSCQGAWMYCAGGLSTLYDRSGNLRHGTLINMEPIDWILGHVPCPDVPGAKQLEWNDPDDLPVGGKIRVWLLSYDANVHRQHVATIDRGVEAWIPDFVRIAQGANVPIANMPGHYLFQLDAISPNGNQSPPSNTIEAVCPFV